MPPSGGNIANVIANTSLFSATILGEQFRSTF
jgi:hypothetical protein